VVDPVMVASSGAQLLEDEAVEALVDRLLPLATVVTPNRAEAQVLAGVEQQTVTKFELAERIHALGAAAVIVTGGHGEPVDRFFDGGEHVEIPIERHDFGATHGSGCTHSATLFAGLARGLFLRGEAEHAALAGALVLNIGTLSPPWVEAMLAAGRAANSANVPIVLDPVGAGATSYRTEAARRLLTELDIGVVRGNAAEIATLAGREAEIRGVE